MGPKNPSKVDPNEEKLNELIEELNDLALDITETHQIGESLVENPNKIKIFKARLSRIDSTFDKFSKLVPKAKLLATTRGEKEKVTQLGKLSERIREKFYAALAYEIKDSERDPATSCSPNRQQEPSYKLPTIPIPTFDGNISQWRPFKDVFVSLIHDNRDLSSIQKFHYLKSALKGIAYQTVSSIPIISENYAIAWLALCKKFDNKKIQAINYLQKIFTFKPMTKCNLQALEDLSNVVLESISAFKSLQLKDETGCIFLALILRMFDSKSREKFETEYLKDSEEPNLEAVVEFIHKQYAFYQTEAINSLGQSSTVPAKHTNKVLASTLSAEDTTNKCPMCPDRHRLFRCSKFIALDPTRRYKKVKALKLCFNCLAPNKHFSRDCSSKFTCQVCDRKHHSLLHFGRKDKQVEQNENDKNVLTNNSNQLSPVQVAFTQNNRVVSLDNPEKESFVILGTALARLRDRFGQFQNIRLLIDCGSQRSIITSSCARKLGLNLIHNPHKLIGLVNSAIEGGKYQTTCVLKPQNSEQPEFRTNAVVVSQITSDTPSNTILRSIRKHLKRFSLADPAFWKPASIDFLLGADLFGAILSGEAVSLGPGLPHVIKTIFGWVVMGPSEMTSPNDVSLMATVCPENNTLNDTLEKFWQVEEINVTSPENPADIECENHFVETHSRNTEGRYIVRLPFKISDSSLLVESKPLALQRFLKLEARLEKTPQFKAAYSKIIQEYLDLGFMTKAEVEGKYFLPHHAVIKNSTSTGVRIVFDASSSTSVGSLNDHLQTGPKLQRDIREVLLHFRKFPIPLTADMCKMFLQILVHPDDRVFQHIFYRFHPSEVVQEFQLNRVTFGMTSSPYLAIRVIKQIVIDEGSNYPKASQALLQHTYVDDVLTGADSEEECIKLQNELTALLAKGGFTLKKWASSSSVVLATIPENIRETPVSFSLSDDPSIKVLGMQWDPKLDNFFYKIQSAAAANTKRAVLSTIARLYDPLGYLAPVIFKAKSFLQYLWSIKLGWDEPLPGPFVGKWNEYLRDLEELKQITIPRAILRNSTTPIYAIGFADASTLGFAAAIYIRSIEQDMVPKLIIAKTKLAPLKSLSIPRLELCAALLLVQTFSTIRGFLNSLDIRGTYLCTDSTVTLGWIKTSPHLLKTFVANRVVAILEGTSENDWYHVSTKDNPADVASRGAYPSELRAHRLWWHGPPWLEDTPGTWPLTKEVNASDLPEKRPNIVLLTEPQINPLIVAIERCSSLTKLQRRMAYIIRFARSFGLDEQPVQKLNSLEMNELWEALEFCIRVTQKHHFGTDLCLKSNRLKQLASLSPFVDTRGIVRVGGRLNNSPLEYTAKHPILLPKKSHLTNLIVDYYHQSYLHAGPRLLHSLLQRRYWILSARSIVRNRIHQCVKCHRFAAPSYTPYMSDLPPSRFEQGRAFMNVGVDFTGPFLTKDSNRRKFNLIKSYICIFVCLSTKAVHLEPVSDLSTNAFLACLDRFVGRRGLPKGIYSDRGTNFVGADRRLKELWNWLKSKETQEEITDYLARQKVKWSFMPPSSPHFGGLWEAGVKSFKTHLVRVLDKRPLNFEELYTISTRIEAVLNSRPLCPISSSPEEYDTLTPGHFLIGAPLVSVPEQGVEEVPLNRLSKWRLLNRCIQDVWKRWRLDYLNTLQQRTKWQQKQDNITLGTLVLIKEKNVAPLNWPAGRIVKCHPGKDGVIRVVSVKTSRGVFVRPVVSLAPLLPSPSPENRQE